MRPLRYRHAEVAYAHDVVMAAASFPLALVLRVGVDGFAYYAERLLVPGTLLLTLIAAVVFWSLGLYRGIWRYASLNDLLGLLRAVTIVLLLFVPGLFLLIRAEDLPRSVPVINWAILLLMLGGPRFVYRVLKDRRAGLLDLGGRERPGVPVLLVGAGDAAETFIRVTSRAQAPLYGVVGMVVTGGGRVGRNIHGVEVLGTIDELPEIVARVAARGRRPQRLILTLPELDGAQVRRLVDLADTLGLSLARLPRIDELQDGLKDRIEVRPVAVEDLLGRPQAALDREAMRRLIAGRRVLITGAGGTIGGELVRQTAALGPAELVLVDSGEFNLYNADLEVGERWPSLPRRALLADIRDRGRLFRIFAETRPDLVFHAAALKHVPLCEANPFEAVLTNAVGSRHVADACRAAGVPVMVQVSTDKAVNPTSVMGASKRIAEAYAQALDATRDGVTRFVTVRFGNVLGSTGSVVPLFQRQLAAREPLTVTHPEVARYFMTVSEAVQLVLHATALPAGAAGHIYVLDMGEPIRIIDLARQMIRLAGLRPGIDIDIKITGLRPGEKMFEEIFHGAEPPVPTGSKGLLLAAPRFAEPERLARAIEELAEIARRGEDRGALVAALRRIIPEYEPSPEVSAIQPARSA